MLCTSVITECQKDEAIIIKDISFVVNRGVIIIEGCCGYAYRIAACCVLKNHRVVENKLWY